MSGRKTADDDARKLAATEPCVKKKIATRTVVLDRARPQEKEPAPKGNIEPRVKPWSGPKKDSRPKSIGSMQPPGK